MTVQSNWETNRMKLCNNPIFLIIYFVFALTLYGQRSTDDKLKPCTNHSVNKGKYKILSSSPGGVESQFDLEIKPKYRTDDNYITIAKEFKEKYCHETRLSVTYLTGKKQWLILDPFDLASTPLAIFYLDKNKSKEGIVVYKVVNGKVETRKLDLTH